MTNDGNIQLFTLWQYAEDELQKHNFYYIPSADLISLSAD